MVIATPLGVFARSQAAGAFVQSVQYRLDKFEIKRPNRVKGAAEEANESEDTMKE